MLLCFYKSYCCDILVLILIQGPSLGHWELQQIVMKAIKWYRIKIQYIYTTVHKPWVTLGLPAWCFVAVVLVFYLLISFWCILWECDCTRQYNFWCCVSLTRSRFPGLSLSHTKQAWMFALHLVLVPIQHSPQSLQACHSAKLVGKPRFYSLPSSYSLQSTLPRPKAPSKKGHEWSSVLPFLSTDL